MGHVSLLEGIIVKLKDEEIFERISKYVEQVRISEGIFPTVRRVEAALGIPKSTVHRYLKDMEADPKYTAKADKFAFDDDTAAWLSNSIACGSPTYEEENIDMYVRLPSAVFGKGMKYILTARGDSMVDADIHEGDLVVIRKQVTADPGDIVVALLNGENTLKRLMLDESGRPYLHPENRNYDDIEICDGDEFYIQGVAVKIIKDINGDPADI